MGVVIVPGKPKKNLSTIIVNNDLTVIVESNETVEIQS